MGRFVRKLGTSYDLKFIWVECFFEDNPLLGPLGFFGQAGFVVFSKQDSYLYFKLLRNHGLPICSVGHVDLDRWWHLHRLMQLMIWWLEVISTTGSPPSCSQPTTGASLMVWFSWNGYRYPPGKINKCPLKRDNFNRKCILQAIDFQGTC